MNHLGRALTEYDDPPIKMLFVYNCNPAVTLPDQNRILSGLNRSDLFTVVFDQVMTDTARWADVVLPATTFFEHYDLALSYGHGNVQLVQPVIEPIEESRPNTDVFSDLAAKLGIGIDELLKTDMESVIHVTGMLPDKVGQPLLEHGVTPRVRPVQFGDTFPRTDDGKVDLLPEKLERQAPEGLYRFRPDPYQEKYPLALVSPATDKTTNSTLGELRTRLARLQIHPDDAESRDLTTGDTARIYNDQGEIHCMVVVNADVKRGVISLPKGLWRHSTMNESTANALVPDELTDLGDGACFNDARVEISRIVTTEIDGQPIAVWTTPETRPNRVH
jgi:anaerobic selenocysteine-containing dehydrogenase